MIEIPFISTSKDCILASSHYPDAAAYRVSLLSAGSTCSSLPAGPVVWLDAGVDGLDRWPDLSKSDKPGNSSLFRQLMLQFPGHSSIGDPTFQAKPDKQLVKTFVFALLNHSISVAPTAQWLSVPQLPYVDGNERNKLNKQLAEATREWQVKTGDQRKLILPVIFSNQRQLNKKTERNKKVDLADGCLAASSAGGIWVVDSSLNDQDGTSNFEQTRFPGLVAFHEELNQKLDKGIVRIAGPYWGMNLVLWARGLVDHPAIGLGNAYRYYLPGGFLKQGEVRAALIPLRRTATVSPELKVWLGQALNQIPKGDPAATLFAEMEKHFGAMSEGSVARNQVAKFYKRWLAKLEKDPTPGRALALYQDLSSAYVLGNGLPDLPTTEKSARNPGKVARQLMLNCL